MTAKNLDVSDSSHPLGDLIAAVRGQNVPSATTGEPIQQLKPPAATVPDGPIGAKVADATRPFLSVLLIPGDASAAEFIDVLVALDAQSVTDFELIILSSADQPDDPRHFEELLAQFSSGLNTRTRVLPSTAHPVTARRQAAAIDSGVNAARGRYLSILDGRSIVFAHYVETFERLSHERHGAVLRSLAVAQPMHSLAWPGNRLGFEPVAGATPASSVHFDPLEHLAESGTPRGSYALPRSFFTERTAAFVDALPGCEEDEVLLAAVLHCGVYESPNEVTILLREFTERGDGVIDEIDAAHRQLGERNSGAGGSPTKEPDPQLQAQLDGAERALAEAQLQLDSAQLDLASARAELGGLRTSTSWHLTAPLRKLSGALHRARPGRSTTND